MFLAIHLLRAIRQDFNLRLADLQTASFPSFFYLAVKSEELAGLEPVAQVLAMKPDALERRPSLSRNHFKNGHRARAEHGSIANFGNHRGHFAWFEFGNSSRVQAIFIAEGEIIEQI